MIHQLYQKQVEAWKEHFAFEDNVYSQNFKNSLLSDRHKDTIELIEAEIERKRGMRIAKDAHEGKAMPADEILLQCENAGYNSAINEDIAYLEEELRKLKNEL